MSSNSYTDTLIVWSDNKEIIKYSNEIAKELKVQIYQPDNITDLMAIPCFIKILDVKYLFDFLKHIGPKSEIEDYFTYDECKMLIIGNTGREIPGAVKGFVEEIPVGFGKKLLYKSIKANLDLAIKDESFRKNQYEKRLFRVMYLYHQIASGEYLDINRLASRLNIGNRTFGRDVQTLRSIDPTLNIYFDKKGHITSMRAPRKKGIKVVAGSKEKIFVDSITRMIDLYQILKQGGSIQFPQYHAKYRKSEKTLTRDIKILREINAERIIKFSKEKGYY